MPFCCNPQIIFCYFYLSEFSHFGLKHIYTGYLVNATPLTVLVIFGFKHIFTGYLVYSFSWIFLKFCSCFCLFVIV